MANKQHAQFSDENGNLFYLESETEDVLDPSGKPLSDGGDLSEASVKFSVDTSRKLPQSGGRFKAFLGSIVKYLTDLGAAAYLAVANNDTTTQPGFVGDARVLKQHRDAINQLSSEINGINVKLYKDINNETVSLPLKDAIKYVCDNYVGLNCSARGRFASAEGWFDYDLIKSADDYCSGFISGHTQSAAYQVYRSRGADAVLKKLGSNVVNLGTGTSFDIKAYYADYKQLTANDFVIEPEALPDQVLGSKGTHTVNSSNVYAWMRFTKTKNYNAETGILTAYVTPSGGYGSSTAGVSDTASDNRPVHAYLLKS